MRCVDFRVGKFILVKSNKGTASEDANQGDAPTSTPSGDDKSAVEEEHIEDKWSQTSFDKVWYDEQNDETIIKCYPKTGRTHQIRVGTI